MTRFHRHRHLKRKPAAASKRTVDKFVYVAAIVEPFITLPQVIEIFQSKTAEGVSISSWIGFEILTVIWLWYAIVHRERIIFIYQGLFFIFQAAVIIGAFMYGGSL